MSDDRWDVFWAYCRRVRTLKSRELDRHYLIDYIFHLQSQVKNRLPGPSLLPNLRAYSMKVWGSSTLLHEVLPIIPAELRVLEVDIAETREIRSLINFFTAVPLSQLSVIHFGGRTLVGLDASKLARFLRPNRSTLVHLHLLSLPRTVSDLKRIGRFPKVTALGLVQSGPAMELNKFFSVIASSFPKLRSINVTLDDEIEDEVSAAVFEGLAECRKLTSVLLRTSEWKKLTTEGVARFGSWWPLMKSFNLVQFDYYPGQDTNSLAILQDFAQVWSRTLLSLTLPFGGSAPLPSASAVKFKFEKLAELEVGWSYIAESTVESVAEFLTTITSGNLKIMAAQAEFVGEKDYFDLWGEVVQASAIHAVHSDDVPT